MNASIEFKLHPLVEANKATTKERWGTDPTPLAEEARSWVKELQRSDCFYFFESFFHDRKSEALHIYGYLLVQHLMLAMEFENLKPEDVGATQEEVAAWQARCVQIDADLKHFHFAEYMRE